MRRRLAALTVVPLLLLGTAACGEDADTGSENGTSPAAGSADVDMGEEIPGLEVTGELGASPEVTLEDPLENTDTVFEVITAGDGAVVEEGRPASLHMQVANGETGEKTVGTYEQGRPLTGVIAKDQIFPAVHEAIVGLPAGSRVAIATTAEDAFGEQAAQYGVKAEEHVIFIVDVMDVPLTGPEGDEADVPEDVPAIEENAEGDVTGFSFDQAAKPSGELRVTPVIEGDGEPVEAGDSVTFDYLGQIYGTDTVFDESYTTAPRTFQVGAGQLIKGWDEGLVGVKTGSRVIIEAPPEFGYGKQGNPQAKIKGTDTLIFVVDVLGVS